MDRPVVWCSLWGTVDSRPPATAEGGREVKNDRACETYLMTA